MSRQRHKRLGGAHLHNVSRDKSAAWMDVYSVGYKKAVVAVAAEAHLLTQWTRSDGADRNTERETTAAAAWGNNQPIFSQHGLSTDLATIRATAVLFFC